MAAFLVMIHTNCINNITNTSTGSMGTIFVKGLSDSGVSCVHHQFLRQRFSYSATPPVLILAFRPETNLSWLYRLSKHWQIIYYKYFTKKEGLYCCSNSRWNKSVAVYHSHEAHISHRLSGRCSSQHNRYSARYSTQRCCSGRECPKPGAVYPSSFAEDEASTYWKNV